MCSQEALNILKSNPSSPGHIADYEGAPIKLAEVFPRSSMRLDFTDAPPKVAREFPATLELAIQRRAPAMVISSCGSCLEEILKALEDNAVAAGWMPSPLRSGLRLVQRIDALRDAGVITRDLADWAHSLRLDRNESVHELEATPERAIEYVEFIKFVLEAAFALPARLKRLRTSTPPAAAVA
jgi:hypothetical protein